MFVVGVDRLTLGNQPASVDIVALALVQVEWIRQNRRDMSASEGEPGQEPESSEPEPDTEAPNALLHVRGEHRSHHAKQESQKRCAHRNCIPARRWPG